MRQNGKNATQKVALQKMKTACSLVYQKYGNGVPLTQTREKALGCVTIVFIFTLCLTVCKTKEPI